MTDFHDILCGNRAAQWLQSSLELCKIRLSLFVGFSSLASYLIYQPLDFWPGFLTAGAVFILCCGCASLNNLQDRHWDLRFERTKKRALPGQRISPLAAGSQSLILIASGLILLDTIPVTHLPLILGILSIILYNGLYTPLKSMSLLSLAPGVLCGVMPCLIGWTASGGGVFDVRIHCVVMIFGLWQLPHLGLLALSHARDYKNNDIPGFLRQVSETSLKRMIIFWTMNLSLMMVCLILQGIMISSLTRYIVLFQAVSLSAICLMKISRGKESSYRFLFIHLNTSLLLVMVLIVSERMVLFA
ncbi:MAG: UbiA family prenyltransferase [Proteobacteria bacterium]|nr:UbiA family prenyltransferase [Pseudomonadota bacterium]